MSNVEAHCGKISQVVVNARHLPRVLPHDHVYGSVVRTWACVTLRPCEHHAMPANEAASFPPDLPLVFEAFFRQTQLHLFKTLP
jgi:hypothetical protein